VINNGAPRIGRKPDIAGPNGFDREQRVQPVDELFPRGRWQVRFQPEIDRVNKHHHQSSRADEKLLNSESQAPRRGREYDEQHHTDTLH
jgi:hypothetical protein